MLCLCRAQPEKTEILQWDKCVDKASMWSSWIKSHQLFPKVGTVILIAAYYSIWLLSITPRLVILQAWFQELSDQSQLHLKKTKESGSVKNCQMLWLSGILKQTYMALKRWSKLWRALKTLADQMKGEEGLFKITHFWTSSIRTTTSVNRPSSIMYIIRCSLIYSA